MGTFNDLTGKKYGRLFVAEHIGLVGGKHKKHAYRCICDCGNEKTIIGESLVSGNTSSCGCVRKEKTKEKNLVHGCSGNSMYNVWKSMKGRCFNHKNKGYDNYGGRGISVCEEWNDYSNFHEDMASTYESGLTLDRIDNNGDYCKDNCRWVPLRTQMRNQRRTIRVEWDGNSVSLRDLCEQKNLNFHMVKNRIFRLGWDVKRAIETPPLRKPKGKITNG